MERLEDPAVVLERVTELRGRAAWREHAQDVVRGDGAGVDRSDDAQMSGTRTSAVAAVTDTAATVLASTEVDIVGVLARPLATSVSQLTCLPDAGWMSWCASH